MDHRAETWYRWRTSHWQDWPLAPARTVTVGGLAAMRPAG
jgi:hypothetical protein